MNTSLPYHVTEPPARLKKAMLDNITLVPTSLLPLKDTYQTLANTYPSGSVLVVPQGHENSRKSWGWSQNFFDIMAGLLSPCRLRTYPKP